MGKQTQWFCDRCKTDVAQPTDLFIIKQAVVDREKHSVNLENKEVCRKCVLELSCAYSDGEV